MLIKTSFTFFPNSFASPFLHYGVSRPLTRKTNLVAAPFK